MTRQWRDDSGNDNAKVLTNYDEGNVNNEVDGHTLLVPTREVAAPGLCNWLVVTHVFY